MCLPTGIIIWTVYLSTIVLQRCFIFARTDAATEMEEVIVDPVSIVANTTV